MRARSETGPKARIESASKDKLRLWLRLLRSTRAIEAELRERLRCEFGTTMPRFDVLAALSRHEKGMTMTALSRLLIVSNGNVTGIVDRLVVDGLVIRIPDENDRRATFVRLTRKGEAQFHTMAAAHEKWIAGMLGNVAPADIDGLTALLGRLSSKPSAGDHE